MGTHACVNLPLVFVCVYLCMYLFLLITFAFHIVACVCASIINGAVMLHTLSMFTTL